MTQKFTQRSIFTTPTNPLIPGTDFAGNTSEEVYVSSRCEKTAWVDTPIMQLSYKIGKAIAASQSDDFNVYKGVIDDHDFYLGCFSGGGKNKNDYFYLDFKNNEYMTSNLFSHLLFKMMIAYERYNNPKKEFDLNFNKIDFSEETIGANQKQQFFISSDALFYVIKDMLVGKEFDNDVESNVFESYTKYLTEDITAYVSNDYDRSKISDASKSIGITAEMKLKIKKPKKVSRPKTKKARLLELKSMYYDGISRFNDDEIEAMPILLQNGYNLAKEAFIQNRDFFGLEEYLLIDGIACGDVKAISFNGPAGVGKTTTIRSIAGCLGMPFVLVGGSANIEEADLLGTRNVEAVDGVSVTTWSDGPISMAIRWGAFLLFDEINAADPGILMKLNTILDGSKSLIVNINEEIKVHPNFVFSEAMNIGSAYAGTDQMNQSHFDRMDEIYKISAKTPEEEAKIISANTGYTNLQNLVKMCNIKKLILELIDTEGDAAEQICSPRRLICWAKKARRTGEFVESSLNTIIAHLTVYDDSFNKLTKEDVLNSSGIASRVLEEIEKTFQNIEY